MPGGRDLLSVVQTAWGRGGSAKLTALASGRRRRTWVWTGLGSPTSSPAMTTWMDRAGIGMRLSICVDTGRPWAELRRIVEVADGQDWRTVYLSDHFLPFAPPGVPAEGSVLECWTILSALGGLTSRIRLGSLVLGNMYRHPAVVANMAASLDRVTGGRVVLGLGAGWQENEHIAYGMGLPAVGERMDRFEESCRVITSLLRNRRTSLVGRYYQLTEASSLRPVSSRVPILIGGSGEHRTMRIAARYADIWHAWLPPSEFRRKCSVLDHHCMQVGREPASIERATGQTVRVTSSPRRSPDGDITGTADDILAALSEYAHSGVSEFVVRDHRNDPVDASIETMSTLMAEVLPRLP